MKSCTAGIGNLVDSATSCMIPRMFVFAGTSAESTTDAPDISVIVRGISGFVMGFPMGCPISHMGEALSRDHGPMTSSGPNGGVQATLSQGHQFEQTSVSDEVRLNLAVVNLKRAFASGSKVPIKVLERLRASNNLDIENFAPADRALMCSSQTSADPIMFSSFQENKNRVFLSSQISKK